MLLVLLSSTTFGSKKNVKTFKKKKKTKTTILFRYIPNEGMILG